MARAQHDPTIDVVLPRASQQKPVDTAAHALIGLMAFFSATTGLRPFCFRHVFPLDHKEDKLLA